MHYVYYHCTKRAHPHCSQKSIRLEKLEDELNAILGKIRISNRFKNWALKYLNELNDKETSDRKSISTNVNEAIKIIDSKLDSLMSYMISPQNADGSILSTDEFKIKKQSLLAEKENLTNQRSQIDDRMVNWMDIVAESFDFATYAQAKFSTANKHERRELMCRFGSKLTLKNNLLAVFLEKPFYNIDKIKSVEPTVYDMFETKDSTELYDDLESKWAQNPSLLPHWYDTRIEKWVQNYLNTSYQDNFIPIPATQAIV